MSNFLLSNLSNKSDFTKFIFASNFSAFFCAISNAFSLISTAVISAFGTNFFNDIAIAPLPVHKSNILGELYF